MEADTRRELGKVLIDIGKYTVTTVIVGSIFKSFSDLWMVYVFGTISVAALFSAGFWHFNKSNKERKK